MTTILIKHTLKSVLPALILAVSLSSIAADSNSQEQTDLAALSAQLSQNASLARYQAGLASLYGVSQWASYENGMANGSDNARVLVNQLLIQRGGTVQRATVSLGDLGAQPEGDGVVLAEDSAP